MLQGVDVRLGLSTTVIWEAVFKQMMYSFFFGCIVAVRGAASTHTFLKQRNKILLNKAIGSCFTGKVRFINSSSS